MGLSFISDSLQGQWSSFQLRIQFHSFAQEQDAIGRLEGCVYGRLLIRSLNYVDAIRTEMTDRSTTFQTYYSSVRLPFIILFGLIPPCFLWYIVSSLFHHFLANLAAIKYVRACMLLALRLFDNNKHLNRTTEEANLLSRSCRKVII